MAVKNITDRQICQAYNISKNNPKKSVLEVLMELTQEPEKVCYRAMERAYNNKLIEYGVSLESGWLTEKGMEESQNV